MHPACWRGSRSPSVADVRGGGGRQRRLSVTAHARSVSAGGPCRAQKTSSGDGIWLFPREATYFDSDFSVPLTQGRSESPRACRKLASHSQAAKTPAPDMAYTDPPACCTKSLVSSSLCCRDRLTPKLPRTAFLRPAGVHPSSCKFGWEPVGCKFQFNLQLLSNSNSHPTGWLADSHDGQQLRQCDGWFLRPWAVARDRKSQDGGLQVLLQNWIIISDLASTARAPLARCLRIPDQNRH